MKIPEGYKTGIVKEKGSEYRNVTHLYKENQDIPMCKWGWNKKPLLRNIISQRGICKICLKRANRDLDGVGPGKKFLTQKINKF